MGKETSWRSISTTVELCGAKLSCARVISSVVEIGAGGHRMTGPGQDVVIRAVRAPKGVGSLFESYRSYIGSGPGGSGLKYWRSPPAGMSEFVTSLDCNLSNFLDYFQVSFTEITGLRLVSSGRSR